jgi:hypothetical protein
MPGALLRKKLVEHLDIEVDEVGEHWIAHLAVGPLSQGVRLAPSATCGQSCLQIC